MSKEPELGQVARAWTSGVAGRPEPDILDCYKAEIYSRR